MVKIVHAADFHLDSAFGSLGGDKAQQRRRESRDSVERLANFVSARGADVLLLSGDLFDSDRAFRETGEALKRAFDGMTARVFIAPGNHDYYGAHTPYDEIDFGSNVHIFKSTEIERVEIPELGCSVYGAAFTAPDCTKQLLEDFCAPDDGQVHIMVLHGDVDGADNRYNRVTKAQIENSGLDYLALGHIHSFSGIRRAGDTFYAYPGCPEGRGFDELGDHGIIAGEVDKGSASLDFVSFARRKYRIIEVDVSGKDPREALFASLPESAATDICRIILKGTTDEKGVDLRSMTDMLEGRFYSLELRDETEIAADIWSKAEEDSLRGLFLRRMRSRLESADEQERRKVEQAVRFGLAAMDGRDL